MVKRVIGAIAAAFVAYAVLNGLMHGFILRGEYGSEAMKGLFRPEGKMMVGLTFAMALVVVWAFVLSYTLFVAPKSLINGLKFGTLWGIATGAGMGFGTYSAMPISATTAVVWCIGTIVQFAVIGLLAGLIVKPPVEA